MVDVLLTNWMLLLVGNVVVLVNSVSVALVVVLSRCVLDCLRLFSSKYVVVLMMVSC